MLYRDYLKSKYQNTAVKLANAEGVPCVLEYSKGKNMRNYEIYANSVQDGTPTPEAPVEIQSVGDLTTKNLFDIDAFLALNDNSAYYSKNENGELVQLKPDYRTDTSLFNYITLSAGNYIISYSNTEVTKCHTYVNGVSKGNKKNFTLTETSTVGFKFYESVGTVLGYIQIEKGSNATEYEPYHKYDIPITVKGKNLFDKSISTNLSIRNETVNTDNSYSIGILKLNKICEILKPNTTYTISCEIECESIPSDVTLSNILLGFSIYTPVSGYSTASAVIKKQLSVGEIYYYSQTTTTPLKFDSGGDYRFVLYRNAYKDADGNYQFPAIICRNIQIEEGTSSTAYEPYKGSETTHIYLDEPLRKVGEYADYIDFKNQKVVRKVKEITFENIKFNEYSYGTALDNTYHFYIRSMSCILSSSMFCNIMKAGDINMNNAVDDSFFTSRYSNQGNGGIYLQIEKSLINGYSGESNAEKLKTFLIDKNAKLLYCTTEYSEETISLPVLKTFKGTSIMSVDTAVLPSNIKVKYIRT